MKCEFAIIRYYPSILSPDFANIGVMLRPLAPPEGPVFVRVTPNFSRVLELDADAPIEILQTLESDLSKHLGPGGSFYGYTLARISDEVLTTGITLTGPDPADVESVEFEIERLMKIFVDVNTPKH